MFWELLETNKIWVANLGGINLGATNYVWKLETFQEVETLIFLYVSPEILL